MSVIKIKLISTSKSKQSIIIFINNLISYLDNLIYVKASYLSKTGDSLFIKISFKQFKFSAAFKGLS